MSTGFSILESIRVHLESLPLLAGVSVLVKRRNHLQSEIERRVAPMQGLAVEVSCPGSTNTHPDLDAPKLDLNCAVDLRFWPLANERSGIPTDTALEAVMFHLHGFEIPRPEMSRKYRMVVTGHEEVDDLMLYVLRISCTPKVLLGRC